MLHDGRHRDVFRPEKGHVPILATRINEEDVIVTRNEVAGYVNDPEFLYFLNVYQYIKLWGLPNGTVGWANEDAYVMDGITALELEAKKIEHDEYEKINKKPSGASALGARRSSI